MNGSNSGAVFFLGTRAHYQVLQQPDSQPYDVENNNASTQTVYQNSSAIQELWPDADEQNNVSERSNWYEAPNVVVTEEKDTCVKRRTKRRTSETALCEEASMQPTQLNTNTNSDPKSKSRRRASLLSSLTQLARRKRRLQSQSAHYLRQLELALTTCTFRESCRCFECQSRYFECDEDEYSSDDDEYQYYAAQYYASQMSNTCQHDDDDEVFVDAIPEDTTSTDMLLDSDEPAEAPAAAARAPEPREPGLEIEVAAGTPIVLDYLLTHPLTCNIQ